MDKIGAAKERSSMTMENHAANDEKSAEHYTGELFGQLMQIDRVHSKEEI